MEAKSFVILLNPAIHMALQGTEKKYTDHFPNRGFSNVQNKLCKWGTLYHAPICSATAVIKTLYQYKKETQRKTMWPYGDRLLSHQNHSGTTRHLETHTIPITKVRRDKYTFLFISLSWPVSSFLLLYVDDIWRVEMTWRKVSQLLLTFPFTTLQMDSWDSQVRILFSQAQNLARKAADQEEWKREGKEHWVKEIAIRKTGA